MNKITEKIINGYIKCFKQYKPIKSLLGKDSLNWDKINEKLLLQLVHENSRTEFGLKHNFKSIKNISDFRKNVPVMTYEDYKDDIERIIKGEKNILTAKQNLYFATTTGTTSGKEKMMPVSSKHRKFLKKTVYCAMMESLSTKIKSKSSDRIFSIMEVAPKTQITQNKVWYGSISGLITSTMLPFAEYVTSSCGEVFRPPFPMDMRYARMLFALRCPNITVMHAGYAIIFLSHFTFLEKNWKKIVKDIRDGTISDENLPHDFAAKLQKKIKPDPKRAEFLYKIFSKGFDIPICQQIWPRCKLLLTITTGNNKNQLPLLRRYIGDLDYFNLSYQSSESFFGLSYKENNDDYIIPPRAGFFEFIDIDAKNDSEALTAQQLKINKKYYIVVTSLSGLYRYKIGDIVEFKGFINKAPIIAFSHRENEYVSLYGEKWTVGIVEEAIKMTEKTLKDPIVNFFVYPSQNDSPVHFDFFLEFKNGEILKKKTAEIAEMLFANLKICDPHYEGYCKRNKKMGKPKVYILKDGFNDELYNQTMEKRKFSTQVKIPHQITDLEKLEVLKKNLLK